MKHIQKVHGQIRIMLQAVAGTANRNQSTDRYTGSTHHFYAVPVPVRRQIIKTILHQEQHTSIESLTELADALFFGTSHEEKTMGAMVLQYHQELRSNVTLPHLKRWLEALVGWAEIDALCYNIYTADALLANWQEWERFLWSLARSRNVNFRRASLVLLTGPTERSDDVRLYTLGFALIVHLTHERDILITKAISWLLRTMIDTNKQSVADFVTTNEIHLPKLAVRETRRKLVTGKKSRYYNHMKVKAKNSYSFTATMTPYSGESGTWYFVAIPKVMGQTIKSVHGVHARGFGSLPVTVTVGATTWRTSIFRDTSADSYLLFIKASVRTVEGIQIGDSVSVQLTVGQHR